MDEPPAAISFVSTGAPRTLYTTICQGSGVLMVTSPVVGLGITVMPVLPVAALMPVIFVFCGNVGSPGLYKRTVFYYK
jgi:hypothetical protein